jgi:hypothetical protein
MFPVPEHPEGVRRLLDEEASKDETPVFAPMAADPAKVCRLAYSPRSDCQALIV